MQAEVATMSVELNADKKKANTYKGNLNLGKVKNSKKVVEDFIQLRAEDNFQTIVRTSSEEMQLPIWSDFMVFVGRIKREVCIQKIAQNVAWDGQSPDKNYAEIALASLKFSNDGAYVTNSLSISLLVWAMKRLSSGTSNARRRW